MKSLFFSILAVLCSPNFGQDVRRCSRMASGSSPQEVEIHCSCMQQIIEFDEPIYKLTVNQSDCPKIGLKLDWSTLQTYVGVKKLEFDFAHVIFENKANNMPNFSVVEVTFYNSFLPNISENAFKGLKLIETIRFVDSRIILIEAKAFSGFYQLQTVEFINSTINIVKSNAFFDLPLIEELVFSNSRIKIMETNAIHLLNSIKLPKKECIGFLESRMFIPYLMHEVLGKSLQSLENVTLPPDGSKLIFLSSAIGMLNYKSISTDNFAYIIFGGNSINTFESKAISAVIQNDCDIGAILFVGNFFRNIKSEAFIDITGSERNPLNTVFAMIENIFSTVEPKGFLLDSKVETLSINGSMFNCTHCNQFMWILSNEESETQIRLERDLIQTGRCIQEKDLVAFLSECSNDDDGHTLITQPPIKPTQHSSSTFFTEQSSKPTDAPLTSYSNSEIVAFSLSLKIIQIILCYRMFCVN